MPSPIRLTKADARRAMVRHHFSFRSTQSEAFDRLRSVQFDPIAPVGCNHDLVLQARVPDYQIGDWATLAYTHRAIYDGWDKQASLVPFEGWPVRRLNYAVHRRMFEQKIFEDHKDAVDRILGEIAERGPLMPKECEFQMRKEEWKGSWYGPSLTKQTLRALWHSGLVMTAGRKNGQHLYDLTERVVPANLFNQPMLSEADAVRELVLERHRAVGLLRPTASYEVWANPVLSAGRKDAIAELGQRGEIVPIEIEGVRAHATPAFVSTLDQPSIEPRVVFVAPLDQFVWDRRMVAHLFGFDYLWEIYKPEAKRRWGYYVLPVLFGETFAGRAEFWCRDGVLELRRWHSEAESADPRFLGALELALRSFMRYARASEIRATPEVESLIRGLVEGL